MLEHVDDSHPVHALTRYGLSVGERGAKGSEERKIGGGRKRGAREVGRERKGNEGGKDTEFGCVIKLCLNK